MHYVKFYTVFTIILILCKEIYWNKFLRFTNTKICVQQSPILFWRFADRASQYIYLNI